MIEAVKSACLALSVASLFMYALVHTAWIGLFTLIPVVGSFIFYARFEARFSRLCTEQLLKQTKELAERREKKKVHRQSIRASQPRSTDGSFAGSSASSAAEYEESASGRAVPLWGGPEPGDCRAAQKSVSLQA